MKASGIPLREGAVMCVSIVYVVQEVRGHLAVVSAPGDAKTREISLALLDPSRKVKPGDGLRSREGYAVEHLSNPALQAAMELQDVILRASRDALRSLPAPGQA